MRSTKALASHSMGGASMKLMAALAVVGVGLVVIATAIRLSPVAPATPQGPAQHVREVYTFHDLAPMVAASDAVVVGTVMSSSPGRTAGDDADTSGLVFTEVSLRVDAVLYGDLPKGSVTLEIDSSVIPQRNRWDVPNLSILLFLHEKSDRPGLYRPTNSQGVFVVEGDRVSAGVVEDDLTDALARMDRASLISEIKVAASSVRDGSVTPPPPALVNSR